jgi:phosphate-selective porin OprO and OprP
MKGKPGSLKCPLLAGASAIGMLIVGTAGASAATPVELEGAIKAMQAQIAVLQKQVEEARADAAAAKATSDRAASVKADPPKTDDSLDLKVKWKGAPELSSKDGKFKFKVRGRINADYNGIDQDTAITGDPDVSATELRRARLGVEGVMFEDWKYILEVDFANDSTAIKDAYIQYTGWPIYVTVGNFKTPNTLDNLTSANYITFMERAAFIEAFTLDRAIGVGLSHFSPHWTASAGIFGEAPGAAPLFSGFTGDENVTFASRVTAAPINRQLNGVNQVLHLGASVRTRDVGNDQPLLQYRARGADLHLANYFVNTGRIADGDTFWGLELAGVWGPFAAQGEYGHTDVDVYDGAFARSTAFPPGANPLRGRSDPTYDGWYVESSWFLTGESKPYKDGVFQRVKVKNPATFKNGGWGAWQLAGRYDVVDLGDDAFSCPVGIPLYPGTSGVAQAPMCGQQATWQVAVNWYLNDYTRLMFDYSESDISGRFDYNAGATIKGFGMRAQVDW